mmetsp:Transcript_56218/g.127066  ORF Transcript_56218/g.127066 Transcript_56218/m.127066 type:complete len:115 (-) Transcript_56218:1644-1988(-)
MPSSRFMSSPCAPSSATTPLEITAILSAPRIVERRCAMTMVVRRLARRSSSKAACTTRSEAVSSAEVASSKIKIAGSLITALAIAMRCFWPPESRMPFSPTAVSKPSGNPVTKS